MDSDDDIEDKVVAKHPTQQTSGESHTTLRGPVSKAEILKARKRRADFRIGDTTDVTESAGVRAKKIRRTGDAETGVIEEVEGEQDEDTRFEESYVVNGQSVDIEPFNLNDERRDGYFDEEGHFVERGFSAGMEKRERRTDDNDEEGDELTVNSDPWLLEMKQWGKEEAQGVMEKARAAHAEQERKLKEAADAQEEVDVDAEIKKLETLLNEDETVTTAMQRLRPQRRPKSKKSSSSANAEPLQDEATAANNRQKLDAVMETANRLLAAGFSDIYSATTEKAKHWNATRAKQPQIPIAAEDDLEWHYRTSLSDHTLHGPFKTAQMQMWHSQGYFDNGEALIRVRLSDDKITGFKPASRLEWGRYFPIAAKK